MWSILKSGRDLSDGGFSDEGFERKNSHAIGRWFGTLVGVCGVGNEVGLCGGRGR